jgi:hypothetical protein
MAMKVVLAKRFVPLNFSVIDGYPHLVPQIDEWKDMLPRFYEGDNENPFEHAHEFHALMQQLDIHNDDILMKIFCIHWKVMQGNGIEHSLVLVFPL